tara:strand:+ start:1904 stop:2257 length:354 start_codon:yes stop_codon:yes gene_type:complete
MRADIPPCAKPRMTRSDKWKKRQSVLKFFAFRDAVRQYSETHAVARYEFDIEFHVPMPKSWSKKKRALYNGQPHQQRPDLDNYLKAWIDSVFEEDSLVWKVKATKLWTDESGHIIII